jgi:hypothetical protein
VVTPIQRQLQTGGRPIIIHTQPRLVYKFHLFF